jgi:hypothetical protein
MNASNDLVVLGSGVSVPVSAYLLALALEARGVRLAGDGDDILAGPRHLLTDEDRTAIRQLKPHLRQIVSYAAPAKEVM